MSETDRLSALKTLGLLDTPPEERFDRFTRLATRVFSAPVSSLSLLDSDREWIKSSQGLNIAQVSRDVSFCTHTIEIGDALIIADTGSDDRFVGNPMVLDKPGVRFYAGFPIRTPDMHLVGALSVMDYEPREFFGRDIALLSDLAHMVEQEFSLHRQATVDDLTGLSNRRGFLNIGNHAIAMCQRMDRAATLMFFDLDGFKAVNDTYGHAEGDKVLQEIGRILLEQFRHSDVIARLGGDEFCVLLTGTPAENVNRPLENLAGAIQSENEKNPYNIGYSVGTVSLNSEKHKSIHDLLRDADILMYEQKRSKKSAR